MENTILSTKLFIPAPREKAVVRRRLLQELNEGMNRKLTLVSAPAGFGKTTIVSQWIQACNRPVAWLSLEKEESDPRVFLTYFIAAMQTLEKNVGVRAVSLLQSPQIPKMDMLLTSLLNDMNSLPYPFTLVLDDCHTINTQPMSDVLTFLVEHLPSQMLLVMTTREDPSLPLARLRACDQLTEIRGDDLRFHLEEATLFFQKFMNLTLAKEDISALVNRTEGWIAGLQLAGVSLQRQPNPSSFIQSFSGSHHYVMDYLLEEVLNQQPESIQQFLVKTSILNRLCGSLCDAVMVDSPYVGQTTLQALEQSNLFIIPLDHERRWYRYHHLFAELLQKRLTQTEDVAELHSRASHWYEIHHFAIEALQHAAAAGDYKRTERLVEGDGMPLHFQGAINPVLNCLKSLPKSVLVKNPTLSVMYASVLSMSGRLSEVEPKLQAAESALETAEKNNKNRNLVGHIAAIRALVGTMNNQVDEIIYQSQQALDHLSPKSIAVKTATTWKLGIAYQLQEDRSSAKQAYTEAISMSQSSQNKVIFILATTGLGQLQEKDNQLSLAVQTYQSVIKAINDPLSSLVHAAHLGLARIYYQWNELDQSTEHVKKSIELAQQIQPNTHVNSCRVFAAQLHLAKGDTSEAEVIIDDVKQSIDSPLKELTETEVWLRLSQRKIQKASELARSFPLLQARVYLAKGKHENALSLVHTFLAQDHDRKDDTLKGKILLAVILYGMEKKTQAIKALAEALELAKPEGFIRLIIDEGNPMARLLTEFSFKNILPDYVSSLLTSFHAETVEHPPLVEPLSQRELEVLHLISQGLSNQEISSRLYIALDTVKGHNRRIFEKLQVKRRTEAVSIGQKLGLIH
ncbi:LuxR C-terminal-related transcriptional regulator [Bacillus sp. 2205SS5-2]|uniref:LuxR C-terminal-related transcriptional regulator n=1 Tax=Bacillus sp. 2205SS5-2 TaxID=3109031 RepID=UPI0030063D1B